MEIEVSIECHGEECQRMLRAFSADDTKDWKTEGADNCVRVKIKTEKITSLYNLVDDLLRSYEVFKKLDEEQI